MIKRQHGFTLVELMVSLVVSSFLVVGVVNIFTNFKNSYRAQGSLNTMMEDSRYILELIGTEIRRIGFLRNRLLADEDAIFLTDNNVLGGNIDLLQGEHIKGGPDATFFGRVAFRYQVNDATELSLINPNFNSSPCTQDLSLTAGEDPSVETHVVTMFLFVEFDNGLNAPALKCASKRDNVSNPANSVISGAKILMPNVEGIRILYGEDTDGDNWTNHYLREDKVGNWDNVVSIRLSFILATGETNLSKTIPTYVYDGVTYTVSSPDDRRVYRVFSTTLALRNLAL